MAEIESRTGLKDEEDLKDMLFLMKTEVAG
jgi:hypothetical protein